MEHPNGKVARASHSVFTAFISMGKESEKMDRVSLKEKLVFHYIQVSLSVIILPYTRSLICETDNFEYIFMSYHNMNNVGIS